MQKVKFIYNPYSGENAILKELDNVIRIHQKHNLIIEPYRIDFESEMINAFDNIDNTYKYILVSGGDGTVDKAVNCMKQKNIDLPLGIIPMGTANDFAKFIGIPLNVTKACKQILNSKPTSVDLGKINDRYFLNVASTGLFTDVSQKTDVNLKNTIGKLAYYVKGIEQLPNFRKLKVKIVSKEQVFDGNMYLVMIFNGRTAGNFNLAYKAKVDDGMLDVIIIKAGVLKDMISLFIKMLRGDHLEGSAGLMYFKTNKLEVYCDEDIVTDIDGERGPNFPLKIKCIKDGLKVLGYTKKNN